MAPPPAPPPAPPGGVQELIFNSDLTHINLRRTPANALFRLDPGFYTRSQATLAHVERALTGLRSAHSANEFLLNEYYRYTYDMQTSPHHAAWRTWIDPPWTAGTRDFLDMQRDTVVPLGAGVLFAANTEVRAWLATVLAYAPGDVEYLRAWRMATLAAGLKDRELAFEVAVLEELSKEETALWRNTDDTRMGIE